MSAFETEEQRGKRLAEHVRKEKDRPRVLAARYPTMDSKGVASSRSGQSIRKDPKTGETIYPTMVEGK